MIPTLSLIAVIVAVVAGSRVSTVTLVKEATAPPTVIMPVRLSAPLVASVAVGATVEFTLNPVAVPPATLAVER